MLLRKRPDWSRRLPRPLTIPGIMTLATLADLRTLIKKYFPTGRRGRTIPRYVADRLAEAARDDDMTSATVPLMIILALERVPCRPTRH
jgi:hypothetical protein